MRYLFLALSIIMICCINHNTTDYVSLEEELVFVDGYPEIEDLDSVLLHFYWTGNIEEDFIYVEQSMEDLDPKGIGTIPFLLLDTYKRHSAKSSCYLWDFCQKYSKYNYPQITDSCYYYMRSCPNYRFIKRVLSSFNESGLMLSEMDYDVTFVNFCIETAFWGDTSKIVLLEQEYDNPKKRLCLLPYYDLLSSKYGYLEYKTKTNKLLKKIMLNKFGIEND